MQLFISDPQPATIHVLISLFVSPCTSFCSCSNSMHIDDCFPYSFTFFAIFYAMVQMLLCSVTRNPQVTPDMFLISTIRTTLKQSCKSGAEQSQTFLCSKSFCFSRYIIFYHHNVFLGALEKKWTQKGQNNLNLEPRSK